MAGELDISALRSAVAAGEIDTVLACGVDMQGRLIGKRFTGRHFAESAYEETHGCDYLLANDIDMEPVPGYAVTSWAKGYGDLVMKPDLETLRLVPWLEKTALVLCDLQDHRHQDLSHSPRAVLKRQVQRLRKRGWRAYFASELEFYLFQESHASARQKAWKSLATSSPHIEDYLIHLTTREEDFMRTLRNGLESAGIPVENSKGEWGPGQEEINIAYAPALEMADRHTILKNGCKEMADQCGKAVTFMAKYDYALAGNSCHIHNSIWSQEGEKPLFFDPDAEFGMSALMRSWVAGQIKYARDITWLLAPYVNSYKRFQAGTFAPTKILWSRDNRTAGFRLCGEATKGIRIECRIGGADLNPYLAFSGLIAAGIAGVEEKLELDPPFAGDAYSDASLPEFPKTLREAADALCNSAFLQDAFGEDVVAHYAHTADWEQQEYDRRVTDWELQRGFERY